ncbi:neutral/alkaline non-lysosomal ceramidase N-terminal domain-containing protein [Pontibacter cellulosilyticus]|uniref:neutral/alkaline non-lysosomal ceramidase N-terminal domain-containing protein n=1 Tax=Pontibacter cellulosilyticus TaxID=1720253 RepID=UPI001E533B67|nr:neutral/alkaline non-lysosomal ceramidase N-terminal domain-containing protein [Pontibacter cellulosilyticus]
MRKYTFHIRLLWPLLALLLLCQSCVVQELDNTPYTQTDYYHKTVANLNALPAANQLGDTLKAGWAKVNITPPVGTPLAGYGKRCGMKYTTVHDSVWVRTFAFDNGSSQAYFVSLDMLIAPMSVAEVLEQEYKKAGIKPEQVYLAATHTHSSFGGWGKKLAGRIMAGKYKQQVVRQTARYIIQSIKMAQADLQIAKVGFGTANGAAFVMNRLTNSETNRDTTIRFLKFEKRTGEQAILCTFSAHPTILPSMEPILSGDYPNVLVHQLEQEVDFAAFSAGAVGSHSSVYSHGDSFESTEAVGKGLAAAILSAAAKTETAYTFKLQHNRIPLYLPEPHWRLGEHKRFAPGLFYTFFGRYDAYINRLQLGNTVLLGVPADYSGEFMPKLQAKAAQENKAVVVTGFNGSYLGYIIPDEHYSLKKYEARAMNFYGPTAGSYLTHLLLILLSK